MSSYVPKKHQVCVDKCGCFWRGKYEEKGLVIQSYEEKILLAYEQGLKNGRKQGYNEAMDARDTMDKLKEEE
jgi:hypothetical protein